MDKSHQIAAPALMTPRLRALTVEEKLFICLEINDDTTYWGFTEDYFMKNFPKKIDKEPLTGPLVLSGDITHDSLKTKLRRFEFIF